MRTKRYRRLTAAICALVLLLSLAACGGGKSNVQPDPAKVLQDEEAAPVTAPQPEKTGKTEETPTLTLGQLAQADGLHILYENVEEGLPGLAKDKKPYRLYIFEDGEMSIQDSPTKTYGELSKMTDREIADEVYADPDVVRDSPHFAYVKTDNSGNYVASAHIAFCMQYIGSLKTLVITLGKYGLSGEVYESKYIGYMGDPGKYSYFMRGEVLVRDEIDSEYVVVDPADYEGYLPTAAAGLLYDGTVVPAPEDGSFFAVQPMSSGRLLGAEDIQYTQDYSIEIGESAVDVGPFAPEDQLAAFEWFDLYSMEGEDFSSDFIGLQPGGWAFYLAGANEHYRVNFSSGTIPMSQAGAVIIGYNSVDPDHPVSLPAGTIESKQDLWALYGEPHGALVQWKNDRKATQNYYYWKGSCDGGGFFLLYQDDGSDYPMWRYIRVCDPGLSIFENCRNDYRGYNLDVERALIELAG